MKVFYLTQWGNVLYSIGMVFLLIFNFRPLPRLPLRGRSSFPFLEWGYFTKIWWCLVTYYSGVTLRKFGDSKLLITVGLLYENLMMLSFLLQWGYFTKIWWCLVTYYRNNSDIQVLSSQGKLLRPRRGRRGRGRKEKTFNSPYKHILFLYLFV